VSEDAGAQALWRSIVGRPWVWQAVGWLVIGAVWIVLAIGGHEAWRWVVGVAWIVLGGLMLAVAVWDRRHRQGRYAPR